jgi:hypothetical protein
VDPDFNHKEDVSNQRVCTYHIGKSEAFYIFHITTTIITFQQPEIIQ